MSHPATTSFLQLTRHPLKFRLFLLSKLPSAFFSGIRIRQCSEERCEVAVPYKWFSRNPFRSTYFACLAMAAEMSTGALSMAHLYKRRPAVSMLVIRLEAEYYKKATGITVFTCEDGAMIKAAIEAAIATGTSQTVRALSTGRNKEGEEVARFFITWSYKSKGPSV